MNEQTDVRAVTPELAPSTLEQRPGGGFEGLTPRRFVTEWLALTVLMAAGYQALGALWGSIAMFAIAVAYGVWLYAGHRKLPKPPKLPKSAGRTHLIAVFYGFAGSLAFLAFMFAVTFGWILAAFHETVFPDQWGGFVLGMLLILLSLTAAFYFGSLALLRRRDALSGRLGDFIWRDITRPIQSPIWLGVADATAFVGLLTTAVHALVLHPLADAMVAGREASMLDLVRMFPILALGLPASSALWVILWGSFFRERGAQAATLVRSHLQGGAGLQPWQGWVTAGASLLLVFPMLYVIHLGVVAAASVDGVVLGAAAYKAVDDWIAAERDKGLGSGEISARLTRQGHWTPDAPEAGLGALLPDLGARLAEMNGACEIAVAAGTAGAEPTYCLRATCPSPVRWQAPPPLVLFSSHPTENLYWAGHFYFDIFADGVAAAPGGYCTADGRLANDFQG